MREQGVGGQNYRLDHAEVPKRSLWRRIMGRPERYYHNKCHAAVGPVRKAFHLFELVTEQTLQRGALDIKRCPLRRDALAAAKFRRVSRAEPEGLVGKYRPVIRA